MQVELQSLKCVSTSKDAPSVLLSDAELTSSGENGSSCAQTVHTEEKHGSGINTNDVLVCNAGGMEVAL